MVGSALRADGVHGRSARTPPSCNVSAITFRRVSNLLTRTVRLAVFYQAITMLTFGFVIALYVWMPTKRDLCRLAAREGALSSACATSSKSGGAHLVAARLEGISGIEG